MNIKKHIETLHALNEELRGLFPCPYCHLSAEQIEAAAAEDIDIGAMICPHCDTKQIVQSRDGQKAVAEHWEPPIAPSDELKELYFGKAAQEAEARLNEKKPRAW